MYDIAIIGAGPAGITAAVYAARYRLKTLLLSPDIGGWAAKAHRIENFPSRVTVFGKELKGFYMEQVQANDIDYRKETAAEVTREKDSFSIKTDKGEHEARFVLYAVGTKKRKLNVPGEDEFLGKGVALCATCDAPFFKGKEVAVIGGNDSGTTAALLLAEYATKVYIVEMLDKLPTEPVWMEAIGNEPKIEVITGDTVKEITGKDVVQKITLNSGRELEVGGVFIEVGSIPDTSMLDKLDVKKDRWGHIEVDNSQLTSIDRLYAAGDITNGSNYMRQIVAAQAEGAISAQAIYKRIAKGEINET